MGIILVVNICPCIYENVTKKMGVRSQYTENEMKRKYICLKSQDNENWMTRFNNNETIYLFIYVITWVSFILRIFIRLFEKKYEYFCEDTFIF